MRVRRRSRRRFQSAGALVSEKIISPTQRKKMGMGSIIFNDYLPGSI